MQKLTLLTILFLLIDIYPGAFSAQAKDDDIQVGSICKVTDPTGTQLNARLRPNGKVINRVKNGRSVYVQSFSSDNQSKTWVLVAVKNQGNYKILGYVLREFISCY